MKVDQSSHLTFGKKANKYIFQECQNTSLNAIERKGYLYDDAGGIMREKTWWIDPQKFSDMMHDLFLQLSYRLLQ